MLDVKFLTSLEITNDCGNKQKEPLSWSIERVASTPNKCCPIHEERKSNRTLYVFLINRIRSHRKRCRHLSCPPGYALERESEGKEGGMVHMVFLAAVLLPVGESAVRGGAQMEG